MTDKAREAFEKWANADTSKIHADALDEAAMGFAAGWDASQKGPREALLHLFTVTLEELDLNAHAIVNLNHDVMLVPEIGAV